MTDGRRKAAPALGGAAVAWGAMALFLVMLAVLALRAAAGKDPALGGGAPAPAPRRVLVRRVYERRVIVHLAAGSPPRAAQASQQVSAAGAYPAGAPLTRTS